MVYGFILCIGDSLTYGSRENYGRDYAFYLGKILSEKYNQGWVAIAEGLPGETSSELATRVYKTIKKYPECYEVVFLTGTNDSKDNIITPTNIYKENIEQILRVAKVCKRKVYLCTIPDMVGFGCPDYTVRSANRIKEYNEVIEGMTEDNGTKLVELRGLDEDCYSDGVHLNSKGYEEIARRVSEAIISERYYKKKEVNYESTGNKSCI
jgi:lysophospholipase L1-like esterase